MAEKTNRRQFLERASASLTIISTTPRPGSANGGPEDTYLPEHLWRERIRQPDEGKTKLGWFVDTARCIGCHACEVSCKAENDVPLGNFIRQTFYKDVGEYPKVARMFLPMSCQHCEDAPCIKACPCGALHKEPGGTVAVNYEVCCGHGTCVDVCPYGAIYLDPVSKQAVKCHNCYHRTELGMEPACVPTCPTEALYFGDLHDPNSRITQAMQQAKDRGADVTQLRTEKQTKPRMWFAGGAPVEIEPRVPREGESYQGSAYDIYRWKSETDAEP